jgi:hypothetical protein
MRNSSPGSFGVVERGVMLRIPRGSRSPAKRVGPYFTVVSAWGVGLFLLIASGIGG